MNSSKPILIDDCLYRPVEANLHGKPYCKGVIISSTPRHDRIGLISIDEYTRMPKYEDIYTHNLIFMPLSKSKFNSLVPEDSSVILKRIPYGVREMGSDPELFVVDENRVVLPAFMFLPDKKTAMSIPNNPFWDGFQTEFAPIKSSCLEIHTDYIHNCLATLWDKAREFNPKARLVHNNVVEIPMDLLQSALPEHAALGCMPSLNIYNEDPIFIPDSRLLPLRFAGCHVHLGLKYRGDAFTIHQEVYNKVVKMIDAIAGIISVSLFEGLEDPRRRYYYGRAGEYRKPDHGIEYRVLGSAVLIHPILTHVCFDLVRYSTSIGLFTPDRNYVLKTKDKEIQEIINNCDVIGARKLLNKNITTIKAILSGIYRGYGRDDRVLPLILKGAKEFFSTDIVSNWNLERNWIGCSGSKNCKVSKWDGGKLI